mgnify:CR=1 FL=1
MKHPSCVNNSCDDKWTSCNPRFTFVLSETLFEEKAYSRTEDSCYIPVYLNIIYIGQLKLCVVNERRRTGQEAFCNQTIKASFSQNFPRKVRKRKEEIKFS